MKKETLPLDKILMDKGTQARLEAPLAKIEEYKEKMVEMRDHPHPGDTPFPEVVVFFDGTNYILADGFMRCTARKLAGFTDVEAIVHDGPLLAAKDYACAANDSHGLPRSDEDKRNAIKIYLEADPKRKNDSFRKIGEACRISHHTVKKWLEAKGEVSKNRVGKDGRKRQVAGKGKKKDKGEENGKAVFNPESFYREYRRDWQKVMGHIDDLGSKTNTAKSQIKVDLIRVIQSFHTAFRRYFTKATGVSIDD